MTTILKIPLSELNTVDLRPHATPYHYRLLDTLALTTSGLLRIFSLSSLDGQKFATISYPWRGLPLEGPPPPLGQFTVVGAESGGTVSIDVLKTCSHAALSESCRLLWLDRLCIMQTNKADKNWQIKNMKTIYERCSVCIVLLGGLQRLARLGEKTTWAKRAWTLEEALAPPKVVCVYEWTRGAPTCAMNTHGNAVSILERGHSAVTDLKELLEWSMIGRAQLGGFEELPVSPGNGPEGSGQTGDQLALAGGDMLAAGVGEDTIASVEYENSSAELDESQIIAANKAWKEVYDGINVEVIDYTNAHSLWTVIEGSDCKELQDCAIWRCALMRTSSKPVDMIFSIMGLFGVELEPSEFNAGDRTSATIALAQGILQNGGRASWIGLSLSLPPSPFMSTMPAFPEMSVAGGAVVHTSGGPRSVSDFVDVEWCLEGAPRGRVDHNGYLWISGQAAPIRRIDDSRDDTGEDMVLEAEVNKGISRVVVDGSTENAETDESTMKWRIVEDLDGVFPKEYAIVVGQKHPSIPPQYSMFYVRKCVVLMIIEEHGDGRFHRSAFATAEPGVVEHWRHRQFSIGGPKDPPSRHAIE